MILEKTLIMSNLNMFYKWYKQCKRGYIGVAPHAQHSSQQHCGGQILPCPSNVATSYKTYNLHLAFSQEITQNCNDDLYIDIFILKNIMFCSFIFSPFLKTQLCSGCGCAALVGDPGHAVILSPTTSIVSFVLNTLNGQPETLLYCKNCNMII